MRVTQEYVKKYFLALKKDKSKEKCHKKHCCNI